MKIDVAEPLLHIEAGAGFPDPGQVAVTDDEGVGIVGAETLEERLHCGFLGRRAGVGGAPLSVESALVADTDAVGVVAAGVGAGLALGAAGIEHAVTGDVVVIAH